jgi:hypothetical protein
MKNTVFALLLWGVFCFAAEAQKPTAPWTDWDKKAAEKILNESAWGRIQVVSDVSELTANPGGRGNPLESSQASNRAAQGSLNQEVHVKYYIRFFTAKPVREAIARLMALQNQPSPQLDAQLNEFINRNMGDFIIVTVNMVATDPRLGGPAMQALNSAAAGTLKNNTYLERNDGKRIFLADYRIPGGDLLGAKFIFPRMVDGKPFLDKDSGNVRFISEVSNNVKLNMRFKVKDMIYNGQLEY